MTAQRDQSAVDVAIAAATALRSGSDAAVPADERAWLYQDVACGRCGAVVQVVKFSPRHTSVQWTADSALTCAEFSATERQAHRARAPIPSCVSLRASINSAVAEGRLDIQPP